jgi:hypothetical protein
MGGCKMIKIKNKYNFPLIINLNECRSVHIAPFAEIDIEDKDSNAPDLLSKIKRKIIEEVTSKSIKKVEEVKETVKEIDTANQFTTQKQKIKKEEVDK